MVNTPNSKYDEDKIQNLMHDNNTDNKANYCFCSLFSFSEVVKRVITKNSEDPLFLCFPVLQKIFALAFY